MNFFKKRGVILFIILSLVVAWFFRYLTFNKELEKYKKLNLVNRYEKIGEWVPYGDNYLGSDYCYGYSIRINKVRIVEYNEYINELNKLGYDESNDTTTLPQKIIEIEVTLKNEKNTYAGINFLSTWLVGEDFYTTLEPQWFEVVNSLDPSSMGGVKLQQDTEFTLKLPYSLTENAYRKKPGRTITKEHMWLALTGYPTEIWAKVQ